MRRFWERARGRAWDCESRPDGWAWTIGTASFTSVALLTAVILSATPASWAYADAGELLQFVEGIDRRERPMSSDELNALQDPFADLVRASSGPLPTTLDELLERVDDLAGTASALPDQKSYVVSESGTILAGSDHGLDRSFRLVVTRAAATQIGKPTLLISAPAGARQGILEVMGWDAGKQSFNFYRRPQVGQSIWHFKGRTLHSVGSTTRGQSCFECHVHGTPLMKELELPWCNWHSQSSEIPCEAIPDATIRDSPLFQQKSGGEKLEQVVETFAQDTAKRLVSDAAAAGDQVSIRVLLRSLFLNDTVNLRTSARQNGTTRDIFLPQAFFLDVQTFEALGVRAPAFTPIVANARYRDIVLDKYLFRLEQGTFVRPGDTPFVFMVPVKATEEVEIISQLVAQGIVSKHFCVCVAAVDFPNPIYSDARAGLIKYLPSTMTRADGRGNIETEFVASVRRAASSTPLDSAERQFLALWDQPEANAKQEVERRLQACADAVVARVSTDEGFDDFVRLAESRRRLFQNHSLFEFPLLLPVNEIDLPAPLRMLPDAHVAP